MLLLDNLVESGEAAVTLFLCVVPVLPSYLHNVEESVQVIQMFKGHSSGVLMVVVL